jgi:hypothetical protein
MYVLEPGQEGVVEANPDAVGLKIGVVYDTNNKAKEFLYHRFLCKNNSVFNISEVDSEEVSFYGNDIVNIGKGKVKETDDVPFQMGASAVANKAHKVDHSAAGVYTKDHSKDSGKDKKSDDSPANKKEIKLVGGMSVSVPTDMNSAMNMIKNKANEVKDKVKEKAKNVEEKIKEKVKTLDEKAKDLIKTKKERENEDRIEQERIRYEAEREAREEEERLAEEKYQEELQEAEKEARLLRESEEAMMLEMQRLEEEQAEREAEEEARKLAEQEKNKKSVGGFFGRKKTATDTPPAPDIQESMSPTTLKESPKKTKESSAVKIMVPKKSNKPEVILSADPVLHPRPKKINPNGNRKKTSYEGAKSSIMRQTTAPHDDVDKRSDFESKEVRNARIKRRRGAFKWLPTHFANDLLHGSYWFLGGSVLAMLIPVVPILSILYHFYVHHGSLETTVYFYIYGLLIFSGLMFSIGSYHFLRVFIEPPPEPHLVFCRCLSNGANDELLAAWYFFLGTAPTIPVVTFYVVYANYSSTFVVALVVCIIATSVMFLFVYVCIPDEDVYLHNLEGGPHQPKATSTIAPFFQKWCCGYSFHRHLLNDWLVAGWAMYWCCLFGSVCSLGMLLYYIYNYNVEEIYNWVTGLIDCILFTIGCCYFVAGSYPAAQSDLPKYQKYNDISSKSVTKSSSSNSKSYNTKSSSSKPTMSTENKKKIDDDDNADY